MFAIPDVTIERDGSKIKVQKARRSYLLSSTWLTATLVLGCASFVQAGNVTLSVGGKVSSGTASISSSGSSTVVSQSSATAIINWNSFSIGQGDTVEFNNGTGSTLNRVTGSSLSTLDGLLSATGSVYLINPNGVIIGKSGVVKTGGSFIASTLDLSDANYLQGGDLSFSGSSLASVINLGKVGSLGGDVTLMAAKVENDGTISAASGSVGLVAGQSILLSDASVDGGRFTVLVGGSDTSVTNKGAISAAAVALQANGGSIYALAGNTSGVINATGVSQSDGKIYLTSGTGGTVDVSGSSMTSSTSSGNGGEISLTGQTIDVASDAHLTASATSTTGTGGTISVIAGANNGSLTFAGVATAKGGKTSGDGGLVETSGASVDFDGAIVNTSATKGKTGTWLTDPYDLTVDATAASTIDTNLATTNVTLATTATGTSGPGNANASGVGDINIDAPITWSSSNSLTLNAYLGININAPITVTGAGGVVLTTNNGGTGGALSFGLTPIGFAGNVTYSGAPHTGQTLSINGNAYTLVYSMSDLAGVNNASGHYALAVALDAGATIYTAAVVPNFSGTFEGLGHTIANLSISNSSAANPIGLFGSLSGTIADIGLVGVSITGQSDVGGLAGYMRFAMITNSFSSGSVSGQDVVGGLVGENDEGGQLTNDFASAATTGQGIVGGLAGENYGAIFSSDATGAVIGSNGLIGGLVGANYAGVRGDYATGSVSGDSDVGGLVGYNLAAVISNDYATGSVSGQTDTGGLVGDNDLATITNAYSTGSVRGQIETGGLVGVNYGTISNTYATGAVIGVTSTGGLVGLDGTGTVSSGYWDLSTSGQGASGGGTGLTTAQLQSGVLPTGFDASVWSVGPGLYPYLTSFYPNGVQAISGFAYSNGGSTALKGAQVSLVSNGSSLGSAGTGADGYYYVLLPTGTVSAGTNNLLAYTTSSSATLASSTGTTAETGVDLYGDSLAGSVTGITLTAASSNLKSGALAVAGSNTAAQAAINGATGLWLNTTGFGFIINTPQDVTSLLHVQTTSEPIIVTANMTVEPGAELDLLAGNNLGFSAPVVVKGNATVNLAFDVTSLDNLQFSTSPFPSSSIQFATASGGTASSSQGGSLTINGNPYTLLYSLNDVAAVNNGSGYYALSHPLDATGSNLSASLVGTLDGTFEGLGNSISNLNIYGADTFTGVFGIVNATGTVRDLTLSGSTVTSSGYSLGALVGYNNGGTVYNDVASNDTVTGGGNTHVGGLVGYNTGTVSDSLSSGTVSGSGQYAGIGGLVGWNTGTLIGDTSSASVTGTASNAFDGGLAGVNNGGTISTSGFTGTVSADGWAVGGLVGYNLGGLTSDTSAGTVTGTGSLSFVGGLAGVDASGFTISSSSSSATVNGTGFSFGGLVGYNQGTLTSDSASGSVTGNGDSYVGGLAGFNLGTMTTDYATGNVSSNGATSQVGGLVGQNFSGSITGSYATGTVTGTGSNGFVGGLIGENKASVSQSYATGNVTGAGFSAGGLVGWNQGTLTQVKYTTGTVEGTGTTDTGGLVGYNLGSIDQAYTNATVSGVGVNIGIGGLIGWNAAGTVTNTYVLGSVTGGNAFVGGVAGVNQSTIEYSYAAGHVTGTGSFTGGFAGYNSGTLIDAYYDDQTTGQAAGTQANGSKGVSTATLKGSLPTGFSTSLWSQTTGQYPTLTNEP